MAARVIAGRAVVPGDAEGVALVTSEALSFWGGFDFNTGTIICALTGTISINHH